MGGRTMQGFLLPRILIRVLALALFMFATTTQAEQAEGDHEVRGTITLGQWSENRVRVVACTAAEPTELLIERLAVSDESYRILFWLYRGVTDRAMSVRVPICGILEIYIYPIVIVEQIDIRRNGLTVTAFAFLTDRGGFLYGITDRKVDGALRGNPYARHFTAPRDGS